MRAKTIPAVLAALLAVLALASSPAHANDKPWVFMLAGQSNMVGQGFPVPVERPDSRILRQGNVGAPWTVAQDPLGGPTDGAGPAMPFAREVLKYHPGVRIVLVPCAMSGTLIKKWRPGGKLYNICVGHMRDAIRRGGIAKGILFAQGEADGADMAAAPQWSQRYRRTIRSFRASLGRPDLPVVHTVIHPDAAYPASSAMVRAEQRRRLNRDDVSVDTRDLALRDGYHYTVPSYRVLGRQMARAWMALA